MLRLQCFGETTEKEGRPGIIEQEGPVLFKVSILDDRPRNPVRRSGEIDRVKLHSAGKLGELQSVLGDAENLLKGLRLGEFLVDANVVMSVRVREFLLATVAFGVIVVR